VKKLKKKLTESDLRDRELMLERAERLRELAEKAQAELDRRPADAAS
jgi:hypothetical protein